MDAGYPHIYIQNTQREESGTGTGELHDQGDKSWDVSPADRACVRGIFTPGDGIQTLGFNLAYSWHFSWTKMNLT